MAEVITNSGATRQCFYFGFCKIIIMKIDDESRRERERITNMTSFKTLFLLLYTIVMLSVFCYVFDREAKKITMTTFESLWGQFFALQRSRWIRETNVSGLADAK
jgi:hypothetical protein